MLYPVIVTDVELAAFQLNCTWYWVVVWTPVNWSTSVCDTPFDVAVSVAFCVVVTASAVATKAALLRPAGIVTEAGTCSELLLLESDTCTWLVAAPLRDTWHAVVVAPNNVRDAQDSLLRLTALVVCGYNVITSVLVTPSALPVMVTLVVLATADETALKLPEVAPAAIVTDEGICRAELLLLSDTLVALLAAPLSVAEQVFD